MKHQPLRESESTASPFRTVVVDVSARDGLQAEPVFLPPERRAAWVRSLLDAGVDEAEAGSFVNPARLPQMAGAERMAALLADVAERVWWLVPNLRGLENAARAGTRQCVALLSATESHSRANLGRPIGVMIEELEAMYSFAAARGMRLRLSVSVAWGDPAEGALPPERVADLLEKMRKLGFQELTLCDTAGTARPEAVAALLDLVLPHYGPEAVGLHLHDAHGLAVKNTETAIDRGVRRFDGAVGGIGGCPFLPGAKGNMNLETLLDVIESKGLTTGVERWALSRARERCLEALSAGEALAG